MAGRPATVRGGGMSGQTYGLIAFVILSVVFLGLFVFQLTTNKEALQAAEQAARDRTRFGQPPAYYQEEHAARGGRTPIFAIMAEDISKFGQLVSGKPEAVFRSVEAEANAQLARIAAAKPGSINASDTLLTAIQKLDNLHTDAVNTNSALSTELASSQGEVLTLTGQLKSVRDEFEAQIASLSHQLKQEQEQYASSLRAKDAQLAEMQSTLDAREQKIQELTRSGLVEARNKDLEIAALRNQLQSLQEEVRALKPSVFDPDAILTKADGRIMRAIPGADMVYINLGRADRLKVGMGFEVYSQTRDVSRTLRGKASIEVVTLLENSSECRVTRTVPGQPIIEGDFIVNIAFERDRKPKFVVRGDFDLNYDGVIDFDGLEAVEAMIRQWGGQVVPELDESTDFVVIGLPPGVPEIAEGEVVSDQVRDQINTRVFERTQYKALFDQAAARYIPVITQSQFLYLTGYSGNPRMALR